MAKKKMPTENLTLRGVEVLRTPWRNFSGTPTKLNADGGKRYFNIRLDKKLAEEMKEAGWLVKELDPYEDGDEPMWIINIAVKFGNRPPRIVTVADGRKTSITEAIVDSLDAADISHADVIIRPYDWGGPQPSAYLQTGFFNIKLDELEREYDMSDEDEVICDEEGVCRLRGVVVN